MKPVNYLIGALLLALIVSLGTCMHYRKGVKECSSRPTKTDTVYKKTVDSSNFQTPTITNIEPGNIQSASTPAVAIKTITVEREGRHDTVYLKADVQPVLNQCVEIVHYDDTVQVQYGQAIIRNRVHNNRLDSQQLILRQSIPKLTTTIMQPKKRTKKWGIGIQAGYGYTITGDPKPKPYIGAGISYTLIHF